MEPAMQAFELETDHLLQTLPPIADTTELSSRVAETRTRYDRLREAFESRLEAIQSGIAMERVTRYSQHLDQLQRKLDA